MEMRLICYCGIQVCGSCFIASYSLGLYFCGVLNLTHKETPCFVFVGATEGQNEHIDLFLRQGLLGGNRVPVVWGGTWELLKMLHDEADVDVGEFGRATDGIVELETEEQAKTSPYASYGMKCSPSVQHLCTDEPRFCAKCWIDRDDGIKPQMQQQDSPRGQVQWHHGWRSHQLTGRNLAVAVLQALQIAVKQWGDGVAGTLLL